MVRKVVMKAAVRPVGLYSVLVRQALLLPHLTEEETEAQRITQGLQVVRGRILI